MAAVEELDTEPIGLSGCPYGEITQRRLMSV
jgi:hypothetical protein